MDTFLKIPEDENFTIHISDNMELRNKLRSGLVKAQQKDTDKIPLLVSWPEWLEDGIICIYARDFRTILRKAVRDTALSFERGGAGPEGSETVKSVDEPEEFRALSPGDLERIEIPAGTAENTVEEGEKGDEEHPVDTGSE